MLSNNEKKVIEELKKDSRASIKDISKKTKIKPSTVYQTIKRLKKKNVIEQFTIRTNDRLMQRNLIVFMLVNTQKDIDNSFFESEHIESVYGVTGEFDLLLKMKFKDVDEFNQFVINFRKNKNIKKTLTMVGTARIKES